MSEEFLEKEWGEGVNLSSYYESVLICYNDNLICYNEKQLCYNDIKLCYQQK